VIKRRVTGGIAVKRRRGTQTVENPTMQMVEIEMPSRHNNSGGCYSTSRPGVDIEMSSRNNTAQSEPLPVSKNTGGTGTKKNRTKKNKINKIKSRKMRPKKQQAPVKKTAAQQERREKLRSIHVKRESLDALNNGSVLVEKEQDVVAVDMNTAKRKSFLKIDDEEHGVYFQEVDTEDTVWELPEDGDVVVDDNELQQNPMKRKSFRKIVDDEHGVFFQDVDTEETVWKLPEDGEVVVT
jgi:DNA mismatch repair ATPase MutL